MKARLLACASVIAVTAAVTTAARAETPPTEKPAEKPAAAEASIKTVTEPALPLRAPAPLELAKPAPSTSWGVRLGFVVVAALGGFAYVRSRRRRGALGVAPAPAIRVLGKTSIGLRTDVAIVETGGMRLLVGVTPSSVQTLAVLPNTDEDDDARAIALSMSAEDTKAETRRAPSDPARLGLGAPLASQLALPSPSLGERARALFEKDKGDLEARATESAKAARAITTAAAYASRADEVPAPKPKTRTRTSKATKARDVEGQARGLVLALASKNER